MPPLTVPASQLGDGLDRLISWASNIRDVVCCLDPNLEITCNLPQTLSDTVPTRPLPTYAVNCPPPQTNPPTQPLPIYAVSCPPPQAEPIEQHPIYAVACPPPQGTTRTATATATDATVATGATSAGDLCKALTLLITWAEDLRDITRCIPGSMVIDVPENIIARAKERNEAIRGMQTGNLLHTVSCPPADFVKSGSGGQA